MKIKLSIEIEPKGINELEKEIEELNLRTEIARVIEKAGYKDYKIKSMKNKGKVILD